MIKNKLSKEIKLPYSNVGIINLNRLNKLTTEAKKLSFCISGSTDGEKTFLHIYYYNSLGKIIEEYFELGIPKDLERFRKEND